MINAELLADAAVLSCENLLASELISSMLFQEGILFSISPPQASRETPDWEHVRQRSLKKSVNMESNSKCVPQASPPEK